MNYYHKSSMIFAHEQGIKYFLLNAQSDQNETNRMAKELIDEISNVHSKIHAEQDKYLDYHNFNTNMDHKIRTSKKKRSQSHRSLERELKKTLDPERRLELIAIIDKKKKKRQNLAIKKKKTKERRQEI